MRIGFANIYSWRPHVEHLYYLSLLVQAAGHETAFLTCDSSVPICYSRLLKDRSRAVECPVCMAGGVRSYPVGNVTSIWQRSGGRTLDDAALDAVALSSTSTLNRVETDDELAEPAVAALRQRLHAPIGETYQAASRWIDKERLDAVVCFNGRIDMTAAVIRACADHGIPYVTHERTWFGDGLNLNPNANCLSIRAIDRIVAEFEERPLTRPQAALAGRLAAQRFLRTNALEWRVYNKDAVSTVWPLPATSGPRVLVLPSSKNEFAGEAEWYSEWPDNTVALDELMAAMGIAPSQVVVRCHPNWAEKIGSTVGNRSLALYRAWCAERGIHCISSEEKASTFDLIQEADVVVVNSGSAAVEAGAVGKQIYCIGPAFYQSGGFCHMVPSRAALADPALTVPIDPETVMRKTLRFIYTAARRFPQYNHEVRAVETTRYAYFEGANPNRLIDLLTTGVVEAEDASFAADLREETAVIETLAAKDWQALAAFEETRPVLPRLDIGRRKGLRWIDGVRSRMKRGDVA